MYIFYTLLQLYEYLALLLEITLFWHLKHSLPYTKYFKRDNFVPFVGKANTGRLNRNSYIHQLPSFKSRFS